ncbi:MAG: lysylphosphatidylglycerol synthase domain-containing protein [Microthrixaceae bacterium]
MRSAYLLQTLRWAEVSGPRSGSGSGSGACCPHLLTGEFVSNALPTSFGGDIVRVIRRGNDAGDYAGAFAATSLERLTGWLVLPTLSFVGLALSGQYRSLGDVTVVVVVVNLVTLSA